MRFEEMNLADYIVQGLANQGIETATEIQELVLPPIKNGADVIGISQTGSGKTYAYAIPALERIDTELSAVQFLIICPTRELAAQIADDFRKLTNFTSKISVAPIFGGSNMDRQIQALKKGAKIVIGTPGRLMDHLRRKTIKLNNLKMVILDEADEMLNMGFKEDIETILETTPDTRQTVMFSATMPQEIINITKQYMKEPVLIKTKTQHNAPALIKQYFVNCDKSQKIETLCKIYKEFNPWISIVFCNTKRMTEELSTALTKNGLPAVCLNGDMRQNERSRVMKNFKKDGGGGILIATDVAARGIDIKNVDIVVNYDFPNNEDYYVHRIGRTGRAGKDGIAFTIINSRQQLKDLHALTNKDGSMIEEYASLSTAQWTAKESKTKGISKPAASKIKTNLSPRSEKQKDKKLEKIDFKDSIKNHKKTASQNSNSGKFKDCNYKTEETSKKESKFSRFDKTKPKISAGDNNKTGSKKKQFNSAPPKK